LNNKIDNGYIYFIIVYKFIFPIVVKSIIA